MPRNPKPRQRVACNVCNKAASVVQITQPNTVRVFGFALSAVTDNGSLAPVGFVICLDCLKKLSLLINSLPDVEDIPLGEQDDEEQDIEGENEENEQEGDSDEQITETS